MPRKYIKPARLQAIVRWGDWYDSKLSFFLLAAFYCGLRRPSPGTSEAADMLWLLLLLGAYAVFGHVINDYSDRKVDRAAGKRRAASRLSKPVVLAVAAAAALVGFLPALFRFDAQTTAVTALAFLIAAMYSLPPVRFKERGVTGVVAAALAQRTMPMAIIFEALSVWDWGSISLCLLGLLIGLRFIIVHQVEDRRNDLRSGIHTLATRMGAERLSRVVRRILVPMEAAVAAASIMATSIVAPAAGVAAAAYCGFMLVSIRRGKELPVLSTWLFEYFYSLLWPVALCATLAMREPIFIGMLLITIALQHRRIERLIRRPALLTRPPRRRFNASYKKSNPHPYYTALRAHAPAYLVQTPGTGALWLIPRHCDALTVFRDRRFSKNPATMHAQEQQPSRRMNLVRGFGPDLIEMDPPDHTRLRGLVSRAFTSRQIERLEVRVQQLANDLIDRHLPAGEFDLISTYASVIPITIISEVLGIPIENKERFRSFTYALSIGAPQRGPQERRLQEQKRQFTRFLEKLFAERRREPRDDVLSALVQAGENGDRMSPEELLGMTYLLLLAGYITTVNLIGNGTLALLRHRDQLELLRSRPELMPNAVEELLRFDGPLELSSAHFPTEDMHFDNVVIPRGARVRVATASVNRDEDVFPKPDQLDVTRDARGHLAFGQGIHYCIGAPLARMEARIALRTLIDRCPKLRLADRPPSWLTHPIMRGMRQLPLRA